MNHDIDRIKKDVETIQNALGLLPAAGRDWVRWMKRDRWFSLWWALPGFIVLVAGLLPMDPRIKHFGLGIQQWAGLLTAASLLGIGMANGWRTPQEAGRPEAPNRQMAHWTGKTAESKWFGAALLAQVLLYFVWGWRYDIAFPAFWSGLFVLMGTTCLVAALSTRVWMLLGYAIPFTAYGLIVSLTPGRETVNCALLGLMFIAVALCFTFIQTAQIRQAQAEHESD